VFSCQGSALLNTVRTVDRISDITMKNLTRFPFFSYQVTSLLGDVDVAVKKARLAVQSTSETANTILKDVVTATEVTMTTLNIAIYCGY
jgi:hypothetical protein